MDTGESVYDLLERARTGDRAATTRLLEMVRPHLEACARGYCDPAGGESTADLVQESWLRAWQRLDQFEAEGPDEEVLRRFHGWVGQIVHRLGLNRQRDRRAQRRHPAGRALVPLQPAQGSTVARGAAPPAALEPTPSAVVRGDEEVRLVQEAVDALESELDRAIIRLRFFDGLPLKHVAERLKISYDRARERYRISLEALERALGSLQ